ncbi:MerR-like DNA binding protein [Anaerobacterium chartisolvens]|uniref:MerR-like DNA binding protein n=1 Tax=Anaerobacterium chartisolvens TaxID=1297424 RepID=A0A369B663_9FIRM|nr:MerR family transcriptional regulator [Anaerobacterium chartisolvens]RCX16815.1 MerR-like DNA binding protein [Anaerobacterium chartisolvens]
MEILKDRYTITELSERLEITDHALRYYEKEFNLKVPKDERGRRYYTPEYANIMYQIKKMRSEGLEIKAIKKVLQAEIAVESPPVVLNEDSFSVVPFNQSDNSKDIREFFEEFKEQLTSGMASELSSTRDHITTEISKTKLELGACVENSMRRLENKMEKHFSEVDRCIGNWREKNKRGFFKRLFK